jgi:hypothetical protein
MSEIMSNPEVRENEVLAPRINQEFLKFADQSYQKLHSEYEGMVKAGFMKENEIAGLIGKRKQEYEQLDFDGRIAVLTNNFYFWWPNGYYRELLNQRRGRLLEASENSEDAEKIVKDQKMISDIDTIIKKLGYDETMIELVAKRNVVGEDRNKKMIALGKVFLELLELGYDGNEMRK